MPGHDLIVIGGSAGAVQVLSEIVRGLPPDLPAAVLVVIHTSPTSPGVMAAILNRASRLPAAGAKNGEKILPGRIYVAPPGQHLIVKNHRLWLSRGPKENGFRPAVDPLFRTAAEEFGSRVVGVVVSGGLDDGTRGLLEIDRRGGITIAQDPIEAAFPSMPASAVETARVDYVLPAAEIAAMLTQLATKSVEKPGGHRPTHNGKSKPDIAEAGSEALRHKVYSHAPSGFTCRECGGALWDLIEGDNTYYRCHVGHGYSEEALLAYQTDGVEAAFWTALRALEEHANLQHKMAQRSRRRWPALAGQYEDRAKEAERQATVVRRLLLKKLPEVDVDEKSSSVPPRRKKTPYPKVKAKKVSGV